MAFGAIQQQESSDSKQSTEISCCSSLPVQLATLLLESATRGGSRGVVESDPAVEGEPGHWPGLPLADGGHGQPLVLPADVEVLPADVVPVVLRHRGHDVDHVAAEGKPAGGTVVLAAALLAPVLQEHDELLQLVGAHGVGAQALDQPEEGHGAPAVQPLVPLQGGLS